MKLANSLILSLAALVAPAWSNAQSFDCVTNNGACSTAESLLSWTFDGSLLTIANTSTSGNDSFIRNIYFDFDSGMSVSLAGSSGGTVAFEADGNPINLPGGNTVLPSFSSVANWQATSPGATNGVNAGETISFSLTGVSLNNFVDGSMRVGIHLQGLPAGISESLVSTVTVVPEPESYAMMLAGLGMLGVISRRRQSKKS